jgi:hypothetical protein
MTESDNNWFFAALNVAAYAEFLELPDLVKQANIYIDEALPMFRYVLEENNPLGLQKSALALFAENCMMIFLSCYTRSHSTRSSGNQWSADAS